MIALAPLLADWAEVIIPLLVMIFWVVSQIMGNKNAKPERGRGAGNAAGGNGPKQTDLRSEIENFLKQASGEQEKEAAVEQVKAPPRQRQRAETPVEAVVVEEGRSSGRLTSRHEVSSYVQQHLDTQDIADHAAHLGDDLSQTDERLEARLQATFDHDLGQFQQAESSAAAESSQHMSVLAAEIVEVFRNPREVRRAIILNEILNRPEDRW